jgi:outer membrane lipoprotein-sorting protein
VTRGFCTSALVVTVNLLALVPGPSGVGAQEPVAAEIMDRASSRYGEIAGFCAEFSQSLEVPLLGSTTESKGELCQEKPNMFAMRFSQPNGDAVVADGEFFWVYYPSVDPGQILRFSMDAHPGGMDFHEEFLSSPAEKYEIAYLGEENLNGHETHLISLRPREPAGFEEARIWLDSGRSLILQARIEMENESVRTISLSAIRLDPAPDPARFQFTPPPGAQVIRRD